MDIYGYQWYLTFGGGDRQNSNFRYELELDLSLGWLHAVHEHAPISLGNQTARMRAQYETIARLDSPTQPSIQ